MGAPKREASKVLADNLFILRLNKHKTLRDVAADTGITFQSLNYYETGLKEPRLCTALKLAKYYGVSVEDLYYKDIECVVKPTKWEGGL